MSTFHDKSVKRYKHFSEIQTLLSVLNFEGRISKNTYDVVYGKLCDYDRNIPDADDFIKEMIAEMKSIPNPFPRVSTAATMDKTLFREASVNGIKYQIFVVEKQDY